MLKPMTVEDYDKDERWQAFAAEFIANGGVMTRACIKAGLAIDTAAKSKKQNPVFVEWLEELVKRRRLSVLHKADLRLAEHVDKGTAMSADVCRTQKMFYQREDKFGAAKLQINNNTTINQGDPLNMEIIDELIEWKVAQKMRENALAGLN